MGGGADAWSAIICSLSNDPLYNISRRTREEIFLVVAVIGIFVVSSGLALAEQALEQMHMDGRWALALTLVPYCIWEIRMYLGVVELWMKQSRQ